jgi:metallo-beta-lactamase family protein
MGGDDETRNFGIYLKDMRLTCYGAAKMVTGSNYLLEIGGKKILIDCGLHQGSHFSERKNFELFPYDPKEIEAVLITHAHLDHTGLLPKLVRSGFSGAVYSTPPTRDFAEQLLLDSEGLLLKEAERENLPPIYTMEDVTALMTLWKPVQYHVSIPVAGAQVEFFDAGHILGSSIVAIKAEGKRIVFSGDLGNASTPLIRETEFIEKTDYCVMESTYGDRIHEDVSRRKDLLEDAIEETAMKGGVLMIPAFAMERTQELLLEIHELAKNGRIPKSPVFIDSPLAIKLTAIYEKYRNYFNTEEFPDGGTNGAHLFNFPGLHFTLTPEQSKEINNVAPPKVIIAGSGMSNGGRILHHERRYLSDPRSTILFIGFQAYGSLGRQILDGAKVVKIFGEEVPVRCRVLAIGGYSAHADQVKLLEWVDAMRKSVKRIFLVHGEEGASEALATKIRDTMALDAVVPDMGRGYDL